ncbi:MULTISPECIES: alpha/beta fold hydrolase [unclassified Streptomyces]|uniref:alpha/beta fold hydrolase n=1 Tax=unclassified Streptomyces TaxID=2593676 RepID=UPI0006AE824B|nr:MULTISPECIES: alpha/beta hydrolase [unclassified Streptomyces]KOX21153.1 alpha/beta hydrolase [Streptomyces sp. NRRL F-6491]KOX41160.1 alpha/beta hydrolase [Streptomyces sp. NRRL F-6492]
MPTFLAHDGTELAYHASGSGAPLLCLPGGPMLDSAYLGDLGGLAAHRRLILLDPRGTGDSAVPDDPASYRCDRQVADVEALRTHLGLDAVDVLGHSAGANLAALYTARHPGRVARLVLVTPGTAAVALDTPPEERLAAARLRSGEPWFGPAYAALEEVTAGRGTAETFEAVAPFLHGTWDGAARERHAEDRRRRNDEAGARTNEGAFDPPATRAVLAGFDRPVLVVAGEGDVNTPPPTAAAYAALFPKAELTVLPGAGHFPWHDDAEGFAGAVDAFLAA